MQLKKFLPVESYTLTSALNVDDIKRRISDNIEPKKTFRFSFFEKNSTKPYEGEILGDNFRICRIINYRNSFLPIITGQITSYFGQTRIMIKMRLSLPLIIFMCLWLGVFAVGFLLFLFGQLLSFKEVDQSRSPLSMVILFIMFSFGWSMAFFGFKFESRKSKQFLSDILKGQEAKSN